jgi:hypothetical protein
VSKSISEKITDICAFGGKEAAKEDTRLSQEKADEELLLAISALVQGGDTSLDAISRALNAPVSELKSFLDRHQVQNALVLLNEIDKMVDITQMTYDIQTLVMKELVRRLSSEETDENGKTPLQAMSLKDITQIVDKATKWLMPIQMKTALPATSAVKVNIDNRVGVAGDATIEMIDKAAEAAHKFKQVMAHQQANEAIDITEVVDGEETGTPGDESGDILRDPGAGE